MSSWFFSGGENWTGFRFAWQIIASLIIAYILRVLISNVSTIRSRRKFRESNGCYPVTCRLPLKDPVFGIDFILELMRLFKQKRFLDAFTNQFYKKIGFTFSIERGAQQTVFTIDPENIKTVLAVKFKDFGLGFRAPLFGPVTGRGIFAIDGDQWAHSRSMLRPTFSKDQVADLELTDKHISHLLEKIPRDTTIDFQELLYNFTLDSGTHFLFGQSTDILSNPTKEGREFCEAFDFTLKDVALQIRLGPLRRFQSSKSRRKANIAYRQCRAYVDRYVDQAMALRAASVEGEPQQKDRERGHDSLLKQLAASSVDKEKIRDDLLSVLIAARDTTSNLMGNLFFVLARRPDIWAKLREEVGHLGPGLPAYEELRDLKYAKYCVNECRFGRVGQLQSSR